MAIKGARPANTLGDTYWSHWWPTVKRYTGETAWRHAKFIGQRYNRNVSPYVVAGRAREHEIVC